MEARLNRFRLSGAFGGYFIATVVATMAPLFGQFYPSGMGPMTPMGPVASPGVMLPTAGGPRMAPAVIPAAVHHGSHQRQKAVAQSPNFIVFADQPEWAQEVSQTAERLRSELAVYWLGRELPAWPQRCPLHVNDAENLGAGGETRFALQRGIPGNWMMSVQGTRQRILDSVLPHEITHTIFATHFGRTGKYVPRWADEGASTTVEHEAEKRKHRHFLQQFLKTGRGLAFNEMFRLKEYPQDILPLYAQGHSAVQFLLDQAGPRHFIQFLEVGMQTENWPAALQQFYAYQSIGDFQISWNRWLIDGSPSDLVAYAPLVRSRSQGSLQLAAGVKSAGSGGPAGGSDSVGQTAEPKSPTPSNVPGASDQVIVAMADSDSWFKKRLHETSGSPATAIPPHNHFSGDPVRANPGNTGSGVQGAASHVRAQEDPLDRPVQAVSQPKGQPLSGPSIHARPQPVQNPQVQVLDWGPHYPPAAAASRSPSMTPILR